MENFDDLLRAVLALFPAAEVDEDLDGQIIIYTGVCEGEVVGAHDHLRAIVPFSPDEE